MNPTEEQRRVLPVLEALSDLDVILSVDTYHPETVHAVIDYGAGMINDITGGRDPAVVAAVARSNVAYALMHMQGSPQTTVSYTHLRAHETYDHRERLRSHSVEDDRVSLKKLTTVREGIRRDVQHAHDLRLGERQ